MTMDLNGPLSDQSRAYSLSDALARQWFEELASREVTAGDLWRSASPFLRHLLREAMAWWLERRGDQPIGTGEEPDEALMSLFLRDSESDFTDTRENGSVSPFGFKAAHKGNRTRKTKWMASGPSGPRIRVHFSPGRENGGTFRRKNDGPWELVGERGGVEVHRSKSDAFCIGLVAEEAKDLEARLNGDGPLTGGILQSAQVAFWNAADEIDRIERTARQMAARRDAAQEELTWIRGQIAKANDDLESVRCEVRRELAGQPNKLAALTAEFRRKYAEAV